LVKGSIKGDLLRAGSLSIRAGTLLVSCRKFCHFFFFFQMSVQTVQMRVTTT